MDEERVATMPSVAVRQDRRWVSAAVVAIAMVAVLLAGYLTWVSLREAGEPAGCGAGSGCAAVLASQWSRWFDAPVGAPALAVYLAIVVAGVLARRSTS